MPFDATPLLKWGAVAFGLVVLLVLLNVLRQIYTNWLWFDALSYRSVFTTILFTRVWLFLVGAAVFAAIVTPNAVMAYRSSVGEPAPLLSVDLYALLKRLLVWGTWATVFLISVLFGSILSGQWETVLRFLNTTPFDVQDPVFNRDVSFFVFDLPVLTLMQGWLLGAIITTMLVAGSIFLINVSLRDISLGQAITPQAVSHAHHPAGRSPAGDHVELLAGQVRAALLRRGRHLRRSLHRPQCTAACAVHPHRRGRRHRSLASRQRVLPFGRASSWAVLACG